MTKSPETILRENILLYIKSKLGKVLFKKNGGVFTCPSCKHNLPSALFVTGTVKIFCQACKFKDSIINIVKILESDKASLTDVEICEYLKTHNIEIKEISTDFYLDSYEHFGFDLVPLKPNTKRPFEEEWTKKSHKDKTEWKKWISTGFNIGIKAGVCSGITIVDIDTKEIPEVFKGIKTIIQTTNNGYHFVFAYDAELPNYNMRDNKSPLLNTPLEILNDGRQFVVHPSVVEGKGRIWNYKNYTDFKIPKMPDKVKEFLINNISKNKQTLPSESDVTDEIKTDIKTDNLKVSVDDLQNFDNRRNNTLIKLGGILRKQLNLDQTRFVIDLFNKSFFKKPLDQKEILALLGSLDKYIVTDEISLAKKIMEYLKYAEEGTSRDIKEALQETKYDIDKAISFLMKEKYLIRKRNLYQRTRKMAWRSDYPDLCPDINFKIPYFHDVGNFTKSDQIILGAKTGAGKTTIVMNIIKRLIDQNIRPDLIVLESGSRFIKTGAQLGIGENSYDWAIETNPEKIIPEDNSVTIIDWLSIEDFSATQSVLKNFSELSLIHNCLMIIFMQLKDDDEWFASNLVRNFSSLAARYIYEKDEHGNSDGIMGYWQVDKIREPLRHVKSGKIPCEYNPQTKQLLRIDELGVK